MVNTYGSLLLSRCLINLRNAPSPPSTYIYYLLPVSCFALQSLEVSEVGTKEMPVVHTETKTITYEAAEVK